MTTTETKFPLAFIEPIAEAVKMLLDPHCIRCEIAGSIRRKKEMCKDVEIVCIPKPYDTGFFSSGIATVVNRWEKVKGELPCLYTQRILPEGIKLDLFIATPDNWGYIFMLRTGSREFNFRWVIELKNKFYRLRDGGIFANGYPVPVREESDVFRLLGMEFVEPENRTA